jgi:DNA helicase II / ATP-dependent DNA helicase PcrA
MPWNDDLFGEALHIAQTTATPIRVMAGPGTGKTFAMKRRLMRLLEEGVDPRRILVVTFTRTIADALVKEIGGLKVPGCDRIQASTLHSFCFGVLTRGHVFKYTGRIPRPLVTFSEYGILRFEAEPMLEDLEGPAFGTNRQRTERVRAYEAAFARFQSDNPGPPIDPVDAAFRDVLLRWMKFHEAMLVGELVPEALRYLRDNPLAPERLAFDHVLTDEYQDLNRAEQEVLRLLAGAGYGIFGDEDQSIYSFRYAHPEGIVRFHEAYGPIEDRCLNECRRCPRRVVEMANTLIQNNHTPGSAPRLRPRDGNPEGEVHIVQWEDLKREAEGIAQFAKYLIQKRDYKPADVLVLCPRRRIGYGLRDALAAAGVEAHSFYHEQALEADEARRSFALLTLLARRDDRVALRYWLGDGSPTWNSGEYAVLRQYCEGSGRSPWEAMEGVLNGTLDLSYTGRLRKRFEELMARLANLEQRPLAEVVDQLFPEAQKWATELRDSSLLGGLDGLDAPKLLDRLRYRVTQPELPEAGQVARVMSLHKSKGLTSRAVIVAGCIQGLIPNINESGTSDEQAAHDQEQRRLFYVAMTRCTEVLLFSSVRSLDRHFAYKIGAKVVGGKGENCFPIASTFLDETRPARPESVTGAAFLAGLEGA